MGSKGTDGARGKVSARIGRAGVAAGIALAGLAAWLVHALLGASPGGVPAGGEGRGLADSADGLGATALSAADQRRVAVVRQVADTLERMAREGQPLPFPDRGPPSPKPWADYARERGFSAYEAEIGAFVGVGPAGAAVRRLLVLNHLGRPDAPGGLDERIAQDTLAELRANPAEAIHELRALLDRLPERRGTEERNYALQLVGWMAEADPAGPARGLAVETLRSEAARSVAGQSPSEVDSAALARLKLLELEPGTDASDAFETPVLAAPPAPELEAPASIPQPD